MPQIICQTGTTEHAELVNDTFQLRHYAFHTRRQVQFSYFFFFSLPRLNGILSSIYTTPTRRVKETLHAFQNPIHRPTAQSAESRYGLFK
jgi:hypothetical protein